MKVSKEILNLVPYKPGKPISETQREYGIEKIVKLASNENILGTNPKVVDALIAHMNELHRYPDPSFYNLIQTISKKWRIDHSRISIGNGSNEIIDLLIRIFCEPGNSILTTQMAFVAYGVCAQAARVNIIQTPLKKNFEVSLIEMKNALIKDTQKEIKLVFLPNPNNPTGVCIPQVELLQFLDFFKNDEDRLIILDEAYSEYVRQKDYQSGVHYFEKFNNLVIIRTLSKAYGLAGLRVGMLFAQKEVIDLFNRVRNPFNVNELAQVASIVALEDEEFVKKVVQETWEGLDFIYAEFDKLHINYVKSEGNFILFDTERDVEKVNHELLKKGLILRPVLNYGLKTYLRMTVGTKEENQFALSCLKEVFNLIPKVSLDKSSLK